MAKKKADDGAVFFPEKWLKKLPTGFTDTAESMSEDELKKVVFEAEGNLVIIDREKEAHADLQAAKAVAKDIGGAFREAATAQQAKIKYVLFLLESRGVDLDSTEAKD